ncbi:MAG: RNA-binding domain-containing protein [Candidatus Bathyarchaeia archaeon]|jgi:RNA binding exosome subunit
MYAVQSVEISAIAHATDDLEKVQAALTTILPESLRGRQLFTRRYLEGHYRNPITTFEAKLTKPAEVEEFTTSFFRQLSKSEKLRIERDLALHSDPEGNLYVRLDKQRAFRGTVELGGEDPIRVRLKFNRLSGETTQLMKIILGAD